MLWEVDVHLRDATGDHAARALVAGATELGITGCTHAKTATGWLIEGDLSRADVERLAAAVLADPVTETFVVAEAGDAALVAPAALGLSPADAAGLPIFPGLVRYDEVVLRKEITHAIRFTVQKTRRGYVAPATHWAARSDDENLPPMGMRVRLRENYDISGYSANARVILTALKKYGMILADNGSDWFISGAPDPRWNDDELNTLKKVKGKDLEVVKMERVVTPKSGR